MAANFVYWRGWDLHTTILITSLSWKYWFLPYLHCNSALYALMLYMIYSTWAVANNIIYCAFPCSDVIIFQIRWYAMPWNFHHLDCYKYQITKLIFCPIADCEIYDSESLYSHGYNLCQHPLFSKAWSHIKRTRVAYIVTNIVVYIIIIIYAINK